MAPEVPPRAPEVHAVVQESAQQLVPVRVETVRPARARPDDRPLQLRVALRARAVDEEARAPSARGLLLTPALRVVATSMPAPPGRRGSKTARVPRAASQTKTRDS